KYNMELLAHASYERNSMEIKPALKTLKNAGCKAILMSSQDRQATAFVRMAHTADFHPLYLAISLIDTGEFLKDVKDFNERIYVATVTPLPSENAYPIVKEFNARVRQLNPKAKITPNTLEGYLVGAVFEEVLKRAGKDLTRKSFAR